MTLFEKRSARWDQRVEIRWKAQVSDEKNINQLTLRHAQKGLRGEGGKFCDGALCELLHLKVKPAELRVPPP